MHHFFVEPDQIGQKEILLKGSDVNHIKNVLRMEAGEEICVCTGRDEKEYRCEITSFERDTVTAKIRWVEETGTELASKIYLFQGLPKSDKMEFVIQKAVELGAYQIIPVATKRAVVRLDAKKEETKKKRWNLIAESAAKQSKRMVIPEVTGVMSFSEAVAFARELDVRLIPYELAKGMKETRKKIEDISPGQSVAVFIGPEGGFDDSEIDLAISQGIEPITLGKRILRTETAGLAILSVLMFFLEAQE